MTQCVIQAALYLPLSGEQQLLFHSLGKSDPKVNAENLSTGVLRQLRLGSDEDEGKDQD